MSYAFPPTQIAAIYTTRKPRIGIITTKFGIGSEVWALRQAEALTQFEPVYFAFGKADDAAAVPPGRELHLFGEDHPRWEHYYRKAQRGFKLGQGALPPPSLLRAMRRQLQAARLDVVLCHFAWNAVAVAASGVDCPIICHVHGRDVSANLRWPTNKTAFANALPKFAHVVAVGRFQQDIVQSYHANTDVSVIPCGAPTATFASHPIPARAPNDPLTYITVGRLSEEKGPLQTLKAFEKVCESITNTRLVIIGDGPLMPTLQAQVAASPVADRIVIKGALSPAHIATELAQAHVYLQHARPSGGSIEGFGVTLTEAGAAGLPLIASDIGGIPDQVIPNHNGYLHAANDTARQASYMLDLAHNERKRHAMGQAARQTAQRFDSDLMTQQLEHTICITLGLSYQHPAAIIPQRLAS